MITVRAATTADSRLIFDLIVELAVYEKAPQEVVTDETGIRESLFGPGARAKSLICEVDGKPAGYAVYFYSYSTWLGKNGLYLEDVYVTPAFRGAWRWQGDAAGAGKDCSRGKLRETRMERARLEHPRHRILRISGRQATKRVDQVPPQRR